MFQLFWRIRFGRLWATLIAGAVVGCGGGAPITSPSAPGPAVRDLIVTGQVVVRARTVGIAGIDVYLDGHLIHGIGGEDYFGSSVLTVPLVSSPTTAGSTTVSVGTHQLTALVYEQYGLYSPAPAQYFSDALSRVDLLDRNRQQVVGTKNLEVQEIVVSGQGAMLWTFTVDETGGIR